MELGLGDPVIVSGMLLEYLFCDCPLQQFKLWPALGDYLPLAEFQRTTQEAVDFLNHMFPFLVGGSRRSQLNWLYDFEVILYGPGDAQVMVVMMEKPATVELRCACKFPEGMDVFNNHQNNQNNDNNGNFNIYNGNNRHYLYGDDDGEDGENEDEDDEDTLDMTGFDEW